MSSDAADVARALTVLRESAILVLSVSAAGRVRYASPALERLVGLERAQLVGRDWFSTVLSPDGRERRASFRPGQGGQVHTVRAAGGEERRIEWTSVLAEDDGLLAVGTPVAVHPSAVLQERLRILIESTPAGVAILDRDLRYLACSRRWLSDYHLDGVEIIGRTHYEVFPEIPERWKQIHRECLAGRSRSSDSDRFERADGIVQYLRWAIEPWRELDGEVGGLVFFTEDITEHTRVLLALQESQRHYEGLIAASPVGVFETDANGLCTYVNETWSAITGLPLADALENRWAAALHPEDRARVVEGWQQSMSSKQQFRAEYRFIRPDGGVRWVLGQSVALLDGERVAGFVGTLTDLTERRENEQRRAALESQLRQAQKMESLGTLAGGIAHDFNNLLMAISANLELAQAEPDLPERVRDDLDQIGIATSRAGELVTQILTFSRKQPPRRLPTSLPTVVEEAVRLLQATLPPSVRLVFQSASDVGTVLADPVQLHQVVMNLATNGAQAIERPTGRVTLTVDRVPNEDLSRESLGPGSYTRLRVEDDGRGMDAATAERIFEPFFTSRSVGQGTGLGLSVVHGIVSEHGGRVTVESQPGVGTTFSVLLPSVDLPPAPLPAPRRSVRGHGRILWVED